MSGFDPDYEHPWKGIVQTVVMLIAIVLCVFGGIAMVQGMIAGTVSLWLIPVLILMAAVVGLFSYGIAYMWVQYFKWKKDQK